ncbi:MAG: NYN domain-containing protein [Cyclobacteriaceae bacterium]|nr:NYN domain-containing protein [Cyclobacteriaceae bacterium]
MKTAKDIRIAVLIDADNIPYSKIKVMMEEIAKYGTPTFKRIYGDWTKPNLIGWKNVLLENAITPIQQYGYTTGKNATDSAMIIDAMDILYSEKVDGFCLVSSDSDFTKLATRLREAGMHVIGLGERKTPNPFIVACDKFIYLEILGGGDDVNNETESAKGKRKEKPESKETLRKIDNRTLNLLSTTITDLADDTGWAFLGEVGNLILKKQPDFDPRNYGFGKLAQLIKSIGKYEVDERETEKKNIKLVYVRVR